MPERMKTALLHDAKRMSALGVNSSEDLKSYLYINQYLKTIAKDMSDSDIDLNKLGDYIYKNKEYYSIDTIFNFYKAVNNAMDKLGYPSGMGRFTNKAPHNIGKWSQSMREIYYNVHRGLSFKQAFDFITKDWEQMEKNDFEHWMRFYQEGAQDKYKTAQMFVPTLPTFPNSALEMRDPEIERKKEVNRKLRAIIGRLQSAEKLATDPDLQKELRSVLDIGLPKWLEILHSLKRSIQTAPIRTAKSTLAEDLIIREANRLEHFGYHKTSTFLKKIAQEAVEELPAEEIPLEEGPLESIDVEEDDSIMNDLIGRMNFQDENLSDDLFSFAQDMGDMTEDMMELPEIPGEVPDESVEENIPEEEDNDSIGSNVTIESVIERLERIADLLRRRELPREIAKADIELDILGIAGFFPTIAEAHRSGLESNQYMSSRIEEVLSKLRSGVPTPEKVEHVQELEFEHEHKTDDTLEQFKENLQNQEDKEHERKEKNKIERDSPEEVVKPIPEIPELEEPIEVELPAEEEIPVQPRVPRAPQVPVI